MQFILNMAKSREIESAKNGGFDNFFSVHRSKLSYRMIEIAFRPDYYPDPLIERIVDFGDALEKNNLFMWDVLRNLVASQYESKFSFQRAEPAKINGEVQTFGQLKSDTGQDEE